MIGRIVGYLMAGIGFSLWLLLTFYLVLIVIGYGNWDGRFWAALLLAFIGIPLVLGGIEIDEEATKKQKKLREGYEKDNLRNEKA